MGHHVFYYDGSLKGFAVPTGLRRNAQRQATVNRSCICPFHDVIEIINAKPQPCQNSVKNFVVQRTAKFHCQAAGFLLTYLYKNNFKALNTLVNSAEYTKTRKSVFSFPCLKILLGQKQQWCTKCHHQEPSCCVQTLQLRGYRNSSFLSSSLLSSVVYTPVQKRVYTVYKPATPLKMGRPKQPCPVHLFYPL